MSISAISSASPYVPSAAPAQAATPPAAPPPAAKPVDRPHDHDADDRSVAPASRAAQSSSSVQAGLAALKVGG